MQKVRPCLWFENDLEQAIDFYKTVFPDAQVIDLVRGADGAVLYANFNLAGQEFMALNGRVDASFTHAVSFFITCADQGEVDHYWDKLVDGGKPVQCGWLVDRYGLSWQVVPEILTDHLSSPDQDKAARVMQAMLKMVKIDVAEVERAAAGGDGRPGAEG